MEVIWKSVESTVQPLDVDDQSSPNGVYVRQNITSKARINSDKSETIFWTYEESFLTLNEYQLYTIDQLKSQFVQV